MKLVPCCKLLGELIVGPVALGGSVAVGIFPLPHGSFGEVSEVVIGAWGAGGDG